MPFFHTEALSMSTALLAVLEAFWAAKTFNHFCELAIEISFTEEEIKRVAQANGIDFQQLADTVLYENITVKEYAVSSVEKVFAAPTNNETILKKKTAIESEIAASEAVLKLPQTA